MPAKAVEIDGNPTRSRTAGNTPIHLVGRSVDLDKRTPGVAGAARSSPHSLVQELLNRSTTPVGVRVNGLRLRILRDNVRLTRQAYVEFDLEAMMEGEVYADFVLLWLLCHQSRVEIGRGEATVALAGKMDAGGAGAGDARARRAAQRRGGGDYGLGSGFLTPTRNQALRDRLQSGH